MDTNPTAQPLIRIGKIAAVHGLNGEVILSHSLADKGWITNGMALQMELKKGSFIPYFVKNFRFRNATDCIVHFEDLETQADARTILGRGVFMPQATFQKTATDSPVRFIGYNLVDKKLGSLGAVRDVYQAGPQWIGQIDYHGKEVLFPIIDAFIIEANDRNKFLRVDLPDGLLDL